MKKGKKSERERQTEEREKVACLLSIGKKESFTELPNSCLMCDKKEPQGFH